MCLCSDLWFYLGFPPQHAHAQLLGAENKAQHAC
jgi:hypothetical protein